MITFTEGASGEQVSATLEIPYILTPPVPKEPRINGARVFGVRPYVPFLFKVAATGEPPLKYYAEDLPPTLRIDEETGRITGYLGKKGTYHVKLCVDNAWGHYDRELRIEVGNLISLTPPLGWNSWNCWGLSVDAEKVLGYPVFQSIPNEYADIITSINKGTPIVKLMPRSNVSKAIVNLASQLKQ